MSNERRRTRGPGNPWGGPRARYPGRCRPGVQQLPHDHRPASRRRVPSRGGPAAGAGPAGGRPGRRAPPLGRGRRPRPRLPGALRRAAPGAASGEGPRGRHQHPAQHAQQRRVPALGPAGPRPPDRGHRRPRGGPADLPGRRPHPGRRPGPAAGDRHRWGQHGVHHRPAVRAPLPREPLHGLRQRLAPALSGGGPDRGGVRAGADRRADRAGGDRAAVPPCRLGRLHRILGHHQGRALDPGCERLERRRDHPQGAGEGPPIARARGDPGRGGARRAQPGARRGVPRRSRDPDRGLRLARDRGDEGLRRGPAGGPDLRPPGAHRPRGRA